MKEANTGGKIWSKYFVIVLLIEMCSQLCINFLNTALGIYGDAISGSANYVGLLTTFFTLGAIVLAPFVGAMVDRRGRQKVIIVGVVLFALPFVVFMFCSVQWLVLVLRFVQGLGKSMFQIACAAMVADITPKKRAGEALGYFNLGMTMAMAVGPTVGMLLSDTGDYRMMFGVLTGVMLITLILGFFANYEKKGLYEIQPDSSDRSKGIRRFVEPRALPAGAVRFFASCGSTCAWAFISLHGTKVLGLSAFQTGFFFVASAGGMLLARFVGGKIIDRRGAVAALIPSLSLAIVAYGLLGFFCVGNLPMYLVAGLLFGLCEGISQPALRAVAIVDSPESRRGAANSVINFGIDGGITVAAWIYGMVISADKTASQAVGYRNMYILCIAFTAVALALTLILLNNRARAKRSAKAEVAGR